MPSRMVSNASSSVKATRWSGPHHITEWARDHYACTSRTGEGRMVRRLPGGWACDCPGFTARGWCTHAEHARSYRVWHLTAQTRTTLAEIQTLTGRPWEEAVPSLARLQTLRLEADHEDALFYREVL